MVLAGVNTSRETASPCRPAWDAVSVAPTVPECTTDAPAFAPRLTPAITIVGGGPKAPRRASSTMKAGDAATPYAGTFLTPVSSRRCTTILPFCSTAVMAAPLPLASVSGAATTMSRPWRAAARARCRSPGESMPSSLVIRIRGVMPAPSCRGASVSPVR
nr:hypothetical protein GCM10020092_089190 [Actinoplanes digitatis]